MQLCSLFNSHSARPCKKQQFFRAIDSASTAYATYRADMWISIVTFYDSTSTALVASGRPAGWCGEASFDIIKTSAEKASAETREETKY